MIDALVIGLGNPGREFARTRHNAGAEVVELLAERSNTKLRSGRDRALVGDARVAGKRVVLAVPTTYMNESGYAVAALMRRHKISDALDVIVVHDELDLPPGTLRVKVGGGLAGNNGLRSIVQHIKTHDFVRVRIGIGKPPSKERGADHVLSRLPKAERELIDVAVHRAVDAIEAILTDGVTAAMTTFNERTSPAT
jgi:peptidyl-tRNA hydrolase, PTH1 family